MMAVARVETIRLVRDRVAVSLIALVPAVQILLFGYAVNLDPRSVPIAIAGGDASSAERAARIVGETGYFRIVGDRLPSSEAERMVVNGSALVGIELGAPPVSAPRVVVDASDPGAVRPALSALETAYWRHAATTLSLGAGASVQVDWLFNPDRRTSWTIVPGLVGVIVMISTLMLGALTLARERERGTWEALLATPVEALDALVGKLAPYVLIGTLQGAIVLGI
ncbi:MAG TPA: ABC transporter permease, partial [Alphaproteobacteria bacterium]